MGLYVVVLLSLFLVLGEIPSFGGFLWLPFLLPLTVLYCSDGTEEETGSDPNRSTSAAGPSSGPHNPYCGKDPS